MVSSCIRWVSRNKIWLVWLIPLSQTRNKIGLIPQFVLSTKSNGRLLANSFRFEIDDLLTKQVNSLKAFFVGNLVFVNPPTGYGKSLIFDCLPMVANVLQNKPRGSSIVVVISPPHQSEFVTRNPSNTAWYHRRNGWLMCRLNKQVYFRLLRRLGKVREFFFLSQGKNHRIIFLVREIRNSR